MKPRVGIVGFGAMAMHCHLPAFRKAGWDVAAVLDITPARRAAAEAEGVACVTDRMKTFLAADLDAALVATHSSVRMKVIRPLARAKVSILVEKPLAMTAREARQICDLCDSEGVLASVFHNRRWDPDFLRVRKIIDSGLIGNMLRVENRMFASEPGTKFGSADFHQRWRETAAMGGGAMLDWGPHFIDQVLTLLEPCGNVVGVHADIRHVRFGDADDHFMIDLDFENGTRALVGKSDLCPEADETKWIIVGDRGSLVGDWHTVRATGIRANGRTASKELTANPRGVNLHRNFRDAVIDGKPLAVTARQSLRVCEVMDAARKAAKTGRVVRVDV